MIALDDASPTDAGAVGAILSEFTATTDWMPQIHSQAQDLAHAGEIIDRGWVTVARQQNTVVGFAACNGPELNALYVAQAARGHGIGSVLIEHLRRDRAFLTLWTFQANLGAQRFYRRHGFVEMQRTDGQNNDEKLPDMRFDWKKEMH